MGSDSCSLINRVVKALKELFSGILVRNAAPSHPTVIPASNISTTCRKKRRGKSHQDLSDPRTHAPFEARLQLRI